MLGFSSSFVSSALEIPLPQDLRTDRHHHPLLLARSDYAAELGLILQLGTTSCFLLALRDSLSYWAWLDIP